MYVRVRISLARLPIASKVASGPNISCLLRPNASTIRSICSAVSKQSEFQVPLEQSHGVKVLQWCLYNRFRPLQAAVIFTGDELKSDNTYEYIYRVFLYCVDMIQGQNKDTSSTRFF